MADYRAGATLLMLVERFGVHRTTVAAHLKRRGIAHRGTSRALSDEQVTHAGALYAQGLSLARLGDLYEVHPETIRRSLKGRGIRLRPPLGGPS